MKKIIKTWNVLDYYSHGIGSVFHLVLLLPNHLVHEKYIKKGSSFRFSYVYDEFFFQNTAFSTFSTSDVRQRFFAWKCHSMRNQQVQRQWVRYVIIEISVSISNISPSLRWISQRSVKYHFPLNLKVPFPRTNIQGKISQRILNWVLPFDTRLGMLPCSIKVT